MKLLDWLNDDDEDPPSSPLLNEKLKTLEDLPVRDVMVPRSLITALDADVQLRRVRRLKTLKLPHLLVYRGDLDAVLGWIPKARALELLIDPNEDVQLSDHVHPVGAVDQDAPAARLADWFLKAHSPLLVVRNQANQTVGMVTLDAMVELVFGFSASEFTLPIASVGESPRAHDL